MENHFHTVTQIQEANLSAGMQWLHTSYSMWFNRRRGRVGPLLQGRYRAVLVDPLEWRLEVSRYLHLNPVRVQRLGLDKTARQADRVGAGREPAGPGAGAATARAFARLPLELVSGLCGMEARTGLAGNKDGVESDRHRLCAPTTAGKEGSRTSSLRPRI